VLFDKQFLLSADADWTWDAAAGVFTLYVSRKVAAPAAGDSALSASGGLCVDVTTPSDWGMVRVKQQNACPTSELDQQCSCQIISRKEL